MMAHLSDKAMTDVLEGGGSPTEWAHVASCVGCRSRLEDARAGLGLAAQAAVPEPPGLYWEALRRNVGRRIAEEASPRPRWGWLGTLAATAAALLVLLLFVVDRPPSPSSASAWLPAWSALPPVEDDEGLAVMAEVVTSDAWAADWEEGRGLGAFVAGLSDEESEALVAALRVERPEEDR